MRLFRPSYFKQGVVAKLLVACLLVLVLASFLSSSTFAVWTSTGDFYTPLSPTAELERAHSHWSSSNPPSISYYVVSLQGVPGSHPSNDNRLDVFTKDWKEQCPGSPPIDFLFCPGVVRKGTGYGCTLAFVNCLRQARSKGSDFSFFFEDDASPFFQNSPFCSPEHRSSLVTDLPRDAFALIYGGHDFRFSGPPEPGARYRHTTFSYGTYGFAVPRASLGGLMAGFQSDVDSERKELSPDVSMYKHAADNGKIFYATVPVKVLARAGFSNTHESVKSRHMFPDETSADGPIWPCTGGFLKCLNLEPQ